VTTDVTTAERPLDQLGLARVRGVLAQRLSDTG
jgi:hypothetical protein